VAPSLPYNCTQDAIGIRCLNSGDDVILPSNCTRNAGEVHCYGPGWPPEPVHVIDRPANDRPSGPWFFYALNENTAHGPFSTYEEAIGFCHAHYDFCDGRSFCTAEDSSCPARAANHPIGPVPTETPAPTQSEHSSATAND
jgi:hypothetical protein